MNVQTDACPRQCALVAMWRARLKLVPYVVADEPDPAMLELVHGDDDLIEIARAIEELAPRQGGR